MKKIYVFLLCGLLAGCQSHGLSPSGYKAFVEDPANGFVQSCMIGSTEARVIHVDADYLAIHAFRTNDLEAVQFQEAKDSYKGFEYFKIILKEGEQGSLDAMNTFYDFEFQDHLRLISNTDTLPCRFYLSEPYEGIKKEKKILVGFPDGMLQEDSLVQLWIQPIVNYHVGSELTFDLQLQKPTIEL